MYHKGARMKKERERVPEKIFKEIIAENFPKMEREHTLRLKKHREFPNRLNQGETQ